MKLALPVGTTDITVYVFIQDTSETDGSGLTGLAHDTSSLVCYYLTTQGTATQLNLVTQVVNDPHTDGGFVAVSGTNMPGVYRLDLPDAVASSANPLNALVMLHGAADMAPVLLEIQTFPLPADVIRISGDANSANTLEALTDGGGGTITGNIVGNLSGTVGSVTGAVGSVTGNVGGTINGLTAAAVEDLFSVDSTTDAASAVAGSLVKEILDNAGGFSVQDVVDGVLDEALSGHMTAGTAGRAIADSGSILEDLDDNRIPSALVDGRMASDVTSIAGSTDRATSLSAALDTASGTVIHANVAQWREGTPSTLNAGRVDVTLGHTQVNAITSAAITDGAITTSKVSATFFDGIAPSVWSALTSALTTVGSIGELLVARIDAAISSRMATFTYTAPDNDGIAAIETVTDKLDDTLEDDGGTFRFTEAALAEGPTGGAIPTAGEITDAILDEALAGHVSAGSVGEALGLATDATVGFEALDDDLETLLTRLSSGRADLLDNLDAEVSTRATPAQVNTEVVDALNVDTYPEPGQGAPPANASFGTKVNYLFKGWRNKQTQTATTYSLFNDAGSVVDQKATVSSAAGTTTREELGSGA